MKLRGSKKQNKEVLEESLETELDQTKFMYFSF